MKKNSRWLSIASGRIDFKSALKIPITLLITRGTYIEHFLMGWVKHDPDNITEKIIDWIVSKKWYSNTNIQGIWTHGVTIAGFGIIRCKFLSDELDAALISITDEAPNTEEIKKALLGNIENGKEKWSQFIENSIIPISIREKLPECNLWIANYNISFDESLKQLKYQQIQGCLPEGLRLAQIIAKNTLNDFF